MLELAKLPAEQQLDFWLGEWDVSWGDDQHGTNHIVCILDGRVIQENFDGSPALDFQGMSLSVYSEKLGRWQQTWADSQGSCWHFTGGVVGNEMILTTNDVIDGQPVLLRMVFYNIASDELDWRWERSNDGGETWEERWQIHYRRKKV